MVPVGLKDDVLPWSLPGLLPLSSTATVFSVVFSTSPRWTHETPETPEQLMELLVRNTRKSESPVATWKAN